MFPDEAAKIKDGKTSAITLFFYVNSLIHTKIADFNNYFFTVNDIKVKRIIAIGLYHFRKQKRFALLFL